LLRAADGVVKIVNVKMGEAIKAISTERGFDLRDFSLVPFGGAGPVHACQIAQDLGLPRLLIPPAPGATSALGLLMSDVKHDYLRSRLTDVRETCAADVAALLRELRDDGALQLEREGFSPEQMTFRFYLDMRYAGQGYENPVPIAALPTDDADLQRYREKFDDIHRMCHGHAAPGQPVEIVNYRVEAIGMVPSVEPSEVDDALGPVKDARVGARPAYFSQLSDAPVPVPVYSRELLRAGHRFAGPALVDQYDSTTVVCPGQVVTVDRFGNLLVESAP
jgi:N-methylhydantoinase A